MNISNEAALTRPEDEASHFPASWLQLSRYYNTFSNKLSEFFVGERKKVQQRVHQLSRTILLNEDNFVKVDASKNYLSEESLSLYAKLANELMLEKKIFELSEGGMLNESEKRHVIHTQLRAGKVLDSLCEEQAPRELTTEQSLVFSSLKKIERIGELVSTGALRSSKGTPFRHIVNIGIGGSDLGPCMVCEALSHRELEREVPLSFHFLSNVDGNSLHDLIRDVDVTDALFIVASKSFTTIETLTNVRSIEEVLVQELCKQKVLKGSRETYSIQNSSLLRQHFIAVSCKPASVKNFGIDIHSDYFLEFDEGVGGRYSLWGPVGLSIALKLGFTNFVEFLRGAHTVDKHLFDTPVGDSAPFLMACAEITYVNFFGWKSRAVVPYNERLSKLTSYLQQLEMESNGKSVRSDGRENVRISTCPAVFGGSGTNVQHAFFQLLHQGTDIIPVDFIIALQKGNQLSETHQKWLVANCLAQSQALLLGDRKLVVDGNQIMYNASEPHTKPMYKQFSGDRPSTVIATKELTPSSLGALLALYEHKVFIESVLWEINAFDQWGVELGKNIAQSIYREIDDPNKFTSMHDESTSGMINLYQNIDA